MGFFTQSGEADELLEQHLVLLLDKATFDAEAGVGEVLADVVLDGLLPDAAWRSRCELCSMRRCAPPANRPAQPMRRFAPPA